MFMPSRPEALPLKVCVRVPKNGVVGDVKQAVLNLLHDDERARWREARESERAKARDVEGEGEGEGAAGGESGWEKEDAVTLLDLLAEDDGGRAREEALRPRAEDVVMVDVHRHCVFSVIADDRSLLSLRDGESSLYCYEVDTLGEPPPSHPRGERESHRFTLRL
jgi:hypothetical protein